MAQSGVQRAAPTDLRDQIRASVQTFVREFGPQTLPSPAPEYDHIRLSYSTYTISNNEIRVVGQGQSRSFFSLSRGTGSLRRVYALIAITCNFGGRTCTLYRRPWSTDRSNPKVLQHQRSPERSRSRVGSPLLDARSPADANQSSG